jgi:hypothetical protein
MSTAARQPPVAITRSHPTGTVLRRQCACGNKATSGGECAECKQKRGEAGGMLQRAAINSEPLTAPPSISKRRSYVPSWQPKLMVNTPGDKYEQEADRVAETVMRAPFSAHEDDLTSVSTLRLPNVGLQRQASVSSDSARTEISLIIAIGGGGDNTIAPLLGRAPVKDVLVRVLEAEYPADEVKYFEWDEADRAADWIRKHKAAHPSAGVSIVGHSYGGDTALDVAGAVQSDGIRITHVMTLDPVSWLKSSRTKNVDVWTSAYVEGVDDFSDVIAGSGGHWGKMEGAENLPMPESIRHADAASMYREIVKTLKVRRDEQAAPRSEVNQSAEDDAVRRKENTTSPPKLAPAMASQINSLRGGGQPLSQTTRSFFERRFGQDFSHVRVHTDSRAASVAKSLRAKAFAVGADIAFAHGEYSLDHDTGRRLLAHELTHTLQQRDHGARHTIRRAVETDTIPLFLRDLVHAVNAVDEVPERDLLRTHEFQSFMDPRNVWQWKDNVTRTEAVLACRLMLADLQAGAHISWDADARGYLERAKRSLTASSDRALHQPLESKDLLRLTDSQLQTEYWKVQSWRYERPAPADDDSATQQYLSEIEAELARREHAHSVHELDAEAHTRLIERLQQLGEAASTENSEGEAFRRAVDEFRSLLSLRLDAVPAGAPLSPDVALVMKALLLWSTDPGNKWGEGTWDSSDVIMTASDYATVPASQYKCNAYVAEVIHRSLGLVFRVHASQQQTGKYFPYRAREWGDASVAIPQFTVTTTPALGDIWSNGTHVGIFLGSYADKKLYISARDNGKGVFGLDEKLQAEHGIQIKYLEEGGVYRHYGK